MCEWVGRCEKGVNLRRHDNYMRLIHFEIFLLHNELIDELVTSGLFDDLVRTNSGRVRFDQAWN